MPTPNFPSQRKNQAAERASLFRPTARRKSRMRTEMKKLHSWLPGFPKKRWGLVAIVVLGIPVLLWRGVVIPFTYAIFPFTADSLTTSEEIVALTIATGPHSVGLIVPKAYLTSERQQAGGQYKFVWLLASWPGFGPWSRTQLPTVDPITNTIKLPNPPDPSQRVRVRISYGNNIVRERLTGVSSIDKIDPNDLEYVGETAFGLGRHRRGREVLFVPSDRLGGPPVYFVCSPPPGRCRGVADLQGQLFARFIFDPSLLPEWRELWLGLDTFITSLIAQNVASRSQ